MKIYNSYQEAKIANQDRDIFSLQGKYTCGGDEPLHPDSQGCYWNHCEPSGYLMSVAMFLDSGYKISAGDTFIDTDGKVETMTEIDALNNCINDDDNKRYILNSAWIKEKIPTESPQEREALDMIDTTSKQVESLANNSESPNSLGWSNGDECIYMSHKIIHQFIGPCPKREGYGYIQAPGYEVNFVELSKLSKPESPEQKAERERDEKAKQIMIDICGDDVFKDRNWDYHKKFSHSAKVAFQLVDLGYRKQ